MRIVPQSFEPVINTKDHIKNIANVSRICYKSEDKAKEDETAFVNGLVKGKHNSTLEMSVLHLKITCTDMADALNLVDSNYIICDPVPKQIKQIYYTASIRAWREFIFKHRNEDNPLIDSLSAYLYENLPKIFSNDLPTGVFYLGNIPITEFDPKTLPVEVAKRHIYQGIKFWFFLTTTHFDRYTFYFSRIFFQTDILCCFFRGAITFQINTF